MAVTINGSTGITTPALENDGITTVAPGSAAAPAITTDGDANTGMFFPAADTIAFAEGGTEVGRFDSSANFQFNSGYGSVGTAYGCRAWVNFNGTGAVAIRASGNVSSITDNGTGDYTVNFTTAMPDANYSYALSGQSSNYVYIQSDTAGQLPTVSTFRMRALDASTAAAADRTYISVSIFR